MFHKLQAVIKNAVDAVCIFLMILYIYLSPIFNVRTWCHWSGPLVPMGILY